MIPYHDNVWLNLVTCGLIIFGGIGFLVVLDVIKCRFRFRKFTLHTKVVLTTTAVLLAAGTVLLQLTDGIGWLAAFFHSTSARTAGFSTMPLGELSNAGLFVLTILMFIGASPGPPAAVSRRRPSLSSCRRSPASSASAAPGPSTAACPTAPCAKRPPSRCWA